MSSLKLLAIAALSAAAAAPASAFVIQGPLPVPAQGNPTVPFVQSQGDIQGRYVNNSLFTSAPIAFGASSSYGSPYGYSGGQSSFAPPLWGYTTALPAFAYGAPQIVPPARILPPPTTGKH